jgi:hypothetical protein
MIADRSDLQRCGVEGGLVQNMSVQMDESMKPLDEALLPIDETFSVAPNQRSIGDLANRLKKSLSCF